MLMVVSFRKNVIEKAIENDRRSIKHFSDSGKHFIEVHTSCGALVLTRKGTVGLPMGIDSK